jgi:hypothetical protein
LTSQSLESTNNEDKENNNQNKRKRIEELHAEKEQSYLQAVHAATNGSEQNGIIKRSIQQAALSLEEIYILHGQEWMRQEIGSLIVKDLKVRGFPDGKYRYVYEALSVYDNRFVKPVEHFTGKTVSNLTKEQEIFCRTNAKRYYDAFDTLKNLKHDYNNLLKRDIQALVPRFLDEYDYNEKECKTRTILIEKNKQESFDGGPERFADRISIQKPTPDTPKKMTEELNIWINTFLPALIKKFTEYPITDSRLEKRMAAGWAAIRHAHDSSTDDKYRKSMYDWITIVEFADKSFKHHAASHFKSQDFRGQWRRLTREQIGARQKTVPQWCKWFFETVPGFMEEIAWSRENREPYLSGFSIDLGPKLSDRSIR